MICFPIPHICQPCDPSPIRMIFNQFTYFCNEQKVFPCLEHLWNHKQSLFNGTQHRPPCQLVSYKDVVWPDLQKVLNPYESVKLECMTPKSSDQHFCTRCLSYRLPAILVLINSFPESNHFHTLCRRIFSSISISGL